MKNIFSKIKDRLNFTSHKIKNNIYIKNNLESLKNFDSASLGADDDLPLFQGRPAVVYIIASTERSGSSFLARGLASTNLAGNPSEFFKERRFYSLKQRWKVLSDEFMMQLFANRTSPNGICGIKIHGDIIESTRNYWEPYVNKFILIERKDKISQGISFFKANLTNSWSSKNHPEKFLNLHDYDFVKIAESIALLIDHSAKWIDYFTSRQIKPVKILYEDLEQNPQKTVAETMQDAFGITIDPDIVSFNNLKRQRDELSDYYKQRFLEDFTSKRNILSGDIRGKIDKEIRIYNSQL